MTGVLWCNSDSDGGGCDWGVFWFTHSISTGLEKTGLVGGRGGFSAGRTTSASASVIFNDLNYNSREQKGLILLDRAS